MIYEPSFMAVAVFSAFVAFTLGLSFYFAGKTKSAQSYFAAGGQIHWFVNGVAFAGDYLSAASFLGICGMIAFYGYDGFLYSIGYLAGWVVALFVVAEPLKRLGKFTFADALAAKFNSPGIKLAAGISTLVVSLFYLIPQMVGAGALVRPLLGFGHATGVCLVGAVVVLIVVTAGMVSTTYVQFLKGSLLVVFSTILTVAILNRGLNVPENDPATAESSLIATFAETDKAASKPQTGPYYVAENDLGERQYYRPSKLPDGRDIYLRCQTISLAKDGRKLVNGRRQTRSEKLKLSLLQPGDHFRFEGKPETYVLGKPQSASWEYYNSVGKPAGKVDGDQVVDLLASDLFPVGTVVKLPGEEKSTGPLGPLSFLSTVEQSTMLLWAEDKTKITEADGSVTTVYYPKPTKGTDILMPGNSPTFAGLRQEGFLPKLNFLSLMLALFLGTASLPHILIRYYTVKDQAAARKSTVVGIASIGFFYVLTLYIGLGAMTSGAIDVTNSNMAAPLLAKSISELLFAIISAIAFTTVLGTVAGLIVAASGAIVHDLVTGFFRVELTDHEKVRVGKFGALVVGIIAIVLGIVFEKMNVTFLVGWAFSVAASANMPSLAMLLFWKGTTRQGIIAGILVGMISSLTWVLLSADAYKDVYGLPPDQAIMPFSQPGIVTIPLGFATVILVSLMTRGKATS
ncbi:MAG: cation acetate symporter [Pirellula sp.]|nr:cation acetate symporter [Pirellula sp.]